MERRLQPPFHRQRRAVASRHGSMLCTVCGEETERLTDQGVTICAKCHPVAGEVGEGAGVFESAEEEAVSEGLGQLIEDAATAALADAEPEDVAGEEGEWRRRRQHRHRMKHSKRPSPRKRRFLHPDLRLRNQNHFRRCLRDCRRRLLAV